MDTAEINRKFGRRVQALREAAGLTQDDLAERIDRTTDTVGNIERGVNATRIETAHRLAMVFGIELWELFDFGDSEPAVTRGRRRAVEAIVAPLKELDSHALASVGRIVAEVLKLRAAGMSGSAQPKLEDS